MKANCKWVFWQTYHFSIKIILVSRIHIDRYIHATLKCVVLIVISLFTNVWQCTSKYHLCQYLLTWCVHIYNSDNNMKWWCHNTHADITIRQYLCDTSAANKLKPDWWKIILVLWLLNNCQLRHNLSKYKFSSLFYTRQILLLLQITNIKHQITMALL